MFYMNHLSKNEQSVKQKNLRTGNRSLSVEIPPALQVLECAFS